MRVLGVDPGSVATGWALLEGDSRRQRVVECDVIQLPRRLAFAARLALLQQELARVLQVLQPDAAAVESPFHGRSVRSVLQLAHARGVILAVLSGSNLTVDEYSPAEVKKSVTGSGRAGKEQVAHMVARLLGPAVGSASHDLSDACAVALCHLAGLGTRQALAAHAALKSGPSSR